MKPEIANTFILDKMLKTNDWYDTADFDDNLRKYIVYAKYVNLDVLSTVPDRFEDVPVLVHFSAYRLACKDSFRENSSSLEDLTLLSEEEEAEIPIDLDKLCVELDKLERECGNNVLQDIFFEVHDDKNAITNLSVKYPHIRESMEKLYKEYGFDLIYEEL
jgi:hypothetical protein